MTASPTSAAGIQDAARHLAEGRPAAAVDVLERLVADFPAYVTAHVLLAKAYEASRRSAEALEAWHHAYFLMPGSPLVVRERTRLLRTAPIEGQPDDTATGDAAPEDRAPDEAASEEGDEASLEEWDESSPEMEDATSPPEEAAITYISEEPLVGSDEPSAEPEAAMDETATGPGAMDEADDLDSLIHQLENAPRIRPDPDFRDEGIEEEGDEEGMVSETLARIYATQKQYAAAARAYEQLAEEHPERADEFEAKAAEMHDLAGSDSEA
jgi:tetratricopeptide (TPR) repeat protein